jgi:arsenate reductase
LSLTFYGYDKCGTCRKAKQFLTGKKVTFTDVDITKTPPTKALLTGILKSGDYALKELFNTSGELYRAMDIKSKIGVLSEAELLDLLAKNGKLVKRPVVTDGKRATVGFKEDVFKKIWG